MFFLTFTSSLSVSAKSISKDEAVRLLEPMRAKIVEINESPGAQYTAIGSYSQDLKTETGDLISCQYTFGIRSTKLESHEGHLKRLQEMYFLPNNKFDKVCTKGYEKAQNISRTIWIEKENDFLNMAKFDREIETSTFDLSEVDGKRILTARRDKHSTRYNLDDLKIEFIETNPYSQGEVSVSKKTFNHIAFKNVDVEKIDLTGVEVRKSLELE